MVQRWGNITDGGRRRKRSRLRRWLVNLLLLSIGAVIGLAVVELVLRAVFYFPQPQTLEPNEIVGHRLRPGIRGFQVEEGFARFTINSHGLRDREYPVEKPADVFRIVLLGDSYAEALQVNLDQTFHELLEHRLKKTEILNFGVSGYGTGQELLTYQHFARQFSPDLVILLFCTGNDLSDNSKALGGGYPRPYFHLRDGRLELDNGFRESRRHRFLNKYGSVYYFVTDHSAVAEALDRWRRSKMQRARWRHARKEREGGDQPVEPGLSRGIYGPPTRPELREAWELSERLILEVAKEAADDGASVTLATTTLATQVTADLLTKFIQQHPDWDVDYPDQRLKEFAEKNHIPCLIPATALLELNRETGLRFHGFKGIDAGHWNVAGHNAVAGVFLDFLTTQGLIPPEHRQPKARTSKDADQP